MAEPLKYMYDDAFVAQLAGALKKQQKGFDTGAFSAFVQDKDWESRALKARARHLAVAMHTFLKGSYAEKIAKLDPVAPLFTGFRGIIFPDFVELYGLDDYPISIEALARYTPYSTSEYAIRPFIVSYGSRTLKQMLRWTSHSNHHVRRLASEGCRPRLPWGMALSEFKKDPTPLLPILEQLKADESDYVYRSVANNLNDISKDHPDLVLSLCRKWQGKHPHTDWVIRHACRGLLKKGHSEALGLQGFSPDIKVSVTALKPAASQIRIGDTLEFSFSLCTPSTERLRVEYAIEYVKQYGKTSRKVFKLTELDPLAKKEYLLRGRQRFTDFTTRKHYPGTHRLAIIVNGRERAFCTFELK